MKSERQPQGLASFAIVVLVILAVYLGGYLAFRQSASRGTILLTTKSGPRHPMDYREIVLSPALAKMVHSLYSPVILLDRKLTDTVVTVNIP